MMTSKIFSRKGGTWGKNYEFFLEMAISVLLSIIMFLVFIFFLFLFFKIISTYGYMPISE